MGRGGTPERRGTGGGWRGSRGIEWDRGATVSFWSRLGGVLLSEGEDCEGCIWSSVQLCWYLRLWRTSSGRALVGCLMEAESMKEVRADGAGTDGDCAVEVVAIAK
jgi:hypothetical protein